MSDLTLRQQAILNFVRRAMLKGGRPPTLREIADAFDIASTTGAAKHLKALRDKGHIELLDGARGIRLVGEAKPITTLELPLVGHVAAGEPLFSNAYVERRVAIDRSLFKPQPKYLLRVEGQSMIDAGIQDGDLIGVHPTRNAEHGQIVVARLGEEALTVKRLYRKGNTLRLLPCNPAFAPIDPDPTDDFAVEGLFCGLIRVL
ncbi:transcriptional repressor LexA [Lysobacter sp. HA18]